MFRVEVVPLGYVVFMSRIRREFSPCIVMGTIIAAWPVSIRMAFGGSVTPQRKHRANTADKGVKTSVASEQRCKCWEAGSDDGGAAFDE